MPTIRETLQQARTRLAHLPTPRLDAEWLLCHVLGVSQSYLIAHSTEPLPEQHFNAFMALVERRTAGEPVAYLMSEVGFYGRTFHVTSDVLIPRPETEHLIEAALGFAQRWSQPVIADIGTGSGAIAITLAAELPSAQVYATDISADALTVARQNATSNSVNVTFKQGNLAQPLLPALAGQVHLLAANLPYIASDDVPTLAVSQYEPQLALDGGPDGLDLVRELLAQVPLLCTPDAAILLEIGTTQGPATRQLARDILGDIWATIKKDYAGHDRLVVIER